MTHLSKLYGRHNIPMSKVSSFLEILEEFFDENYADANNIRVTFFQMQGKTKKQSIEMKERPKGITIWAKPQWVFMEQYLPQDYVRQMKLGFIGLTQRHMIALEHKVKFDEHASYFLTLKKIN